MNGIETLKKNVILNLTVFKGIEEESEEVFNEFCVIQKARKFVASNSSVLEQLFTNSNQLMSIFPNCENYTLNCVRSDNCAHFFNCSHLLTTKCRKVYLKHLDDLSFQVAKFSLVEKRVLTGELSAEVIEKGQRFNETVDCLRRSGRWHLQSITHLLQLYGEFPHKYPNIMSKRELSERLRRMCEYIDEEDDEDEAW
jgi:hypothetical protein